MSDKQIGARIRELREVRHYTREAFADKIGISSKFLYEIEAGKKNFSAETLCKIAQELSVSCDYIMSGEDEEHRGITKFLQTLESLGPEKISKLQRLLEELEDICDLM